MQSADRTARWALCFAAALLLFAAACLALATLGFSFGLALTPALSRVILAIAACAAAAACGGPWQRRLMILGALAGLTAAGVAISAVVIDFSYDGQEYQFDAIYALAHGWNPLHDRFVAFKPLGGTDLPWPDHYPLGAWSLAALLGAAGLPLEATKVQGLLLSVSALFAGFAALRAVGLSGALAASLAAVAAANPIVLDQMPSRMTDGVLGSLALCVLAFGAVGAWRRDGLALVCSAAALAFAIDTKGSAILVASGPACGVLLLVLWRRGPSAALRTAVGYGLAACGAVFLIGWHPYVTNTLAHGHPLYPAMGPGHYDIVNAWAPADFASRPPIERFVRSLLAPTNSEDVYAKLPFTIRPGEVLEAGAVDTQLGGLGPLFSGALLLAILTAAATLPRLRRWPVMIPLLTATVIVLSAAIMPAGWWARYIPQLWLAPLLLAVSGLAANRRAARWLAVATIATMAADSAIAAASAARAYRDESRIIWREIADARTAPGGFCANFGGAHARIELLRDAGVHVFPLSDPKLLACPGHKPLESASSQEDEPDQSCPCTEITHEPEGQWTPPPDTLRAYIEARAAARLPTAPRLRK